jgi:YVTN family beta-propeller protein
MKPARVVLAATLLLAVTGPAARAAAHAPAYHIVSRISPGGDGGWDYLTFDPAGRRLFVTRGSHVQVLDAEKGVVVGDIANTGGVHGVALAPDLGRGFTSNGRDTTVTVFDLKTLATVATIRIPGIGPDAIAFEPTTRRVFTFNGHSGDVTAIDAVTDSVVGTVPLGGTPEFAVADGRGHVFVNIEDKSELVEFDPRTLAVIARWPIAPGEGPTGLAMDRQTRRLFVGCGNRHLIAMDADSGRVVADLPIGDGVDAVGFDPATHLVLSSNGEGTLSLAREVSAARLDTLATVLTQRGARTLALDEKTHRIYLATAQFGDPPPPTADRPHPRRPMVPGSFVILVLDPGPASTH